MLFCLPTGDAAELYSKNKLTPVLYDTPVLRQLVHEEVLRMRGKGSGGNAVSLKLFPGGFLVLVGANSSTGIRSHSCKRMFFDEVSAYPITVANSEGDPIAIATKRAETFPDSFQIITSTPTIRGQCRVSLEFEDTNQSKWFVTCPSCQHEFIILWQHIKWDKETSQKKKVHRIDAAYLECPSCGAHHDDLDRQRMAMGGRWVVTNPEITNRAGYWTNAFICCLPAKRGFKNRMHQWADEFLIAHKRGTYFLRSFQMNVLAEPYELDKDPAPNYNILYDRREQYRESMGEIVIPAGVMLLTVGADVQRDRIEAEILGTGFDGETWGIEFRAFYGSTEQPQVYKEFDLWSQKRFRHESGHWMWSACTCIDANFKSESVYRYVRSCSRKVFATIGKRGFAPLGSSWVDRSTSDNDRLWFVKVDGAKESLYSRLRLDEPGPGYQHFPNNDKCRYDEEYFRQLTVEVIRTSPSGQAYFTKPNEESRNESLDCRIYAAAGVEILKPDWAKVKASLAAKPQNDWREKEEGIKAALNLPIPDLRGVEVPEKPDIDMDALRSKLENAPKWMNIR